MTGKGFSVFISCLLLVFSLGIFVSFTSTAHAIDVSEEASNYCLLLPDNENIDVGSYEELEIMLRDYEGEGASAIEGECDQEANFCVRSVEDPENDYAEAEFLSEASEYLNELPNADVSTLEEDNCEGGSTADDDSTSTDCQELERNPICGADGMTYRNECELTQEEAEFEYWGECETQTDSTTDDSSTTQECDSNQAVCSVNDYTYESECLAQQEGVEYTIGACETEEETQECDSEQAVCSEYGYTYQSECLAQQEGVEYTIGACEDTTDENDSSTTEDEPNNNQEKFCIVVDGEKNEFVGEDEAETFYENNGGKFYSRSCSEIPSRNQCEGEPIVGSQANFDNQCKEDEPEDDTIDVPKGIPQQCKDEWNNLNDIRQNYERGNEQMRSDLMSAARELQRCIRNEKGPFCVEIPGKTNQSADTRDQAEEIKNENSNAEILVGQKCEEPENEPEDIPEECEQQSSLSPINLPDNCPDSTEEQDDNTSKQCTDLAERAGKFTAIIQELKQKGAAQNVLDVWKDRKDKAMEELYSCVGIEEEQSGKDTEDLKESIEENSSNKTRLNSLPEFEESSSDSELSDKKCKTIQGVEICSGDLLKTPNNPAVYSVTYDIVDTVKDESLQVMPIRNPQVYFTYADSWDEIKVIERPSIINSMRSIGFAPSRGSNLDPTDIKVGTLVTTPFTNNVYLRAKDGLYLFNSADSLRNQGYELSDIIDISPRLMSKMKNAFSLYEVNENTELLNGLLYKDSNSPDVFFKMDDKKMKFDSLSELKSFASEHNVNINKIPETSGINNFPDDPLLKNQFPDDPLLKNSFPDDPLSKRQFPDDPL